MILFNFLTVNLLYCKMARNVLSFRNRLIAIYNRLIGIVVQMRFKLLLIGINTINYLIIPFCLSKRYT